MWKLFKRRCEHDWRPQVMAKGKPKTGEPVEGFIWVVVCARCGKRETTWPEEEQCSDGSGDL